MLLSLFVSIIMFMMVTVLDNWKSDICRNNFVP